MTRDLHPRPSTILVVVKYENEQQKIEGDSLGVDAFVHDKPVDATFKLLADDSSTSSFYSIDLTDRNQEKNFVFLLLEGVSFHLSKVVAGKRMSLLHSLYDGQATTVVAPAQAKGTCCIN
jgi:hypothetical protein